MAIYNRLEIIAVMEETALVPLFYHPDVSVAKKIMRSCYKGGARLMEFTARGDFAAEVFQELNKLAIKELPGMIMGVGSITDAAAASMFMQLGANFIVTPSLREDIAIVCNRRKVLWLPGCSSLTEINRAEELGCEIIKLFPGDVLGPNFVKAVKGPQPWTKIMPTGGVSTEEHNLRDWFNAGVACVGIGSQLISQEMIQNQSYDLLEKKVSDTLKVIQKIKKTEDGQIQ